MKRKNKKNPILPSFIDAVGLGAGWWAGGKVIQGAYEGVKKHRKERDINPVEFIYRPCPTCKYPVSQYAIQCRNCGKKLRSS